MNLNKVACLCLLMANCLSNLNGAERTYDLAQMGLKADSKKNASPILQRVINRIKAECNPEDSIILRFTEGKYFSMKQDPQYAPITSPTTTRPTPRK